MSDGTVSVIIPAYNAGVFLRACIDSVLQQTRPALEVIVINDGASDDTAAVAASYGDRIRFVSQPNGGVSRARNRGVDVARGDFLAFLDSDDIWMPRKLELQLAEFARVPELDILFGHMEEFDERESVDGQPRYRPPEPARFAGATMLRRDAFHRVGYFRPGLKIAEWLDWCLRAREAGLRERMMPDVLVRRRVHGGNTSYRQIDRRPNLVRAIKESLDRRRAARPPA